LGNFKEHGVMLYLTKELYKGFIKLQADKGLGRSFAGLLPFTEGLYRLGYISEEVYEQHLRKYSKPLGEEASEPTFESKKLQDEKLLRESRDKLFKGQLEQWEQHPDPEWRKKVLAEAEKFKDTLPSAQRLLKKKEEGEAEDGQK